MKRAAGKTSFIAGPGRQWKEILAESIVSVVELSQYLNIDLSGLAKVAAIYPMRINPYFMSLIEKEDDPIWKQAIPDARELENSLCSEDPLLEEEQSPVPNLVHRYPSRVLLMASNLCAMFCRYCMRKRRIGGFQTVGPETISNGLAYIRENKSINEVILSGGDPLMLDDDEIHWILDRLRSISHVDLIRIHTRTPSALPQRITVALATLLSRFHPIYVNIQFNHPTELTAAATASCLRLADAGIPLGCQTVLLKGVNDDVAVLKTLFLNLMRARVRPYYLHHGDVVKGTHHFRTSVQTGLDIMKKLSAFVPGLSLPQYVVDLPGGYGKIPPSGKYVRLGGE